MVRREKEKAAVLILTAVCIVLYVVMPSQLLQQVGIAEGATLPARLAYSFFHASLTHTLINCWCLLSVVFVYDVSAAYLVIAYIIAVTYPIDTISTICCAVNATTPTVGLSAVCFALLGMVSFQSARKLFFHVWILSFFVATTLLAYICSVCGYTIAAPNNTLHIYCYVVGLMVGFLNSPVP